MHIFSLLNTTTFCASDSLSLKKRDARHTLKLSQCCKNVCFLTVKIPLKWIKFSFNCLVSLRESIRYMIITIEQQVFIDK